ncbi:hypothetical protein KI387_021614 [Taxus chinensis]|uniref:Bidirectional sugar transporter SWEET n=1 Tax=Taxus chinensis TaxID=29808 RepID=A0AA38GE12_TAXCH|nr:hypothetical protein KI387_021614 [Taxus chinensis]
MAFPLQLVLGIIGNLTSLALFLSPMATFWGIYKLRSTQKYSGLPYVCTLFTCAFWLLYGAPFVKPHSTLLLTINGAGFLLEIFYVLSFLIFASKKKKMKTLRLIIAMTMAFIMLVVVTIFAMHTHSARQLVAGILCVILSIFMYASPLAVVGLVIRTRSVEYMPFLPSLFNTLNTLVWSGYSVISRDIFLAVPNGIGFLLGIIQLTVYFIYRNSNPVLPASAELPQTKKTDGGFELPIQILIPVEKSKNNKVVSVDTLIADQV